MTTLRDFARIAEDARECEESRLSALGRFCSHPEVYALGWPDDVVEQWLFDHAGHGPFQRDYARVDLNRIRWGVEIVATSTFLAMPTGQSESGCIAKYAENPDWWISVRNSGVHRGVAESWTAHGTWKRWPIVIDRGLLCSGDVGLQLVEGRTRVGILVGRHRNGDYVADSHLAWVGR